MTSPIKRTISLAFLLVILCFTSTLHSCRAEKASPNLVQAEESIQAAFKEVLATENAGVNVTDMLKELNQAVNLLNQLENSNEDPTKASFEGNMSQIQFIYEHAQHVKTAAINAQLQESIADRNYQLMLITLSFISALVFFLTLYKTRRRLKQYRIGTLQNAKSKVG